jgi:FkbM family methyltransferase
MKVYDVPDIDGQLYLRDETDLWGFLQNGVYEPEETKLIKSLVKKDDVCLDIGANIGYFTVLMAKQCKLVYAYEPEPSNYQLLRKNIMLNKTFNIYVNHVALTENSGQAQLHLSAASHGMHRMFPSGLCNSFTTVRTQRFDEAWTNQGKFHVDFIKIDIEGSELGALKGMKEMLSVNKSTMVMEFHPPSIQEYGAKPEDIYQFMKDLGYSIRLVPDIDNEITYQKLFEETNNVRGGQNLLCVPKKEQ